MRYLPDRSIRRRTLIRAGGVVLALPWLEIMRPARATAAPGDGAPRRFITWFTANGTVPDARNCEGTERDFRLSRILKPLERHKGDLIVLEGMKLAGDGYAHWHTMPHQLTGRRHIKGKSVAETAASITLDQELAKRLGAKTKFGSLQLGVNAMTDDGHAIGTISYLGPNQPLFMQDNPFEAFTQIFKDVGDPAVAQRRFRLDKSVLDSVLANAKLFADRLGRDDRARLEAHMDGIRDIEMRMKAPDAAGGTCPVPERIGTGEMVNWKSNTNAPVIGSLQMDIIALAFRCDLTRVVTFQWARAFGSGRVHRWAGSTGNWHNLSHDAAGGNADAKEQMIKIDEWYSLQLATFVDRLKAIREGDRTVFDNTVVFATNEFGWNHVQEQMPFMLLGSAGGYFKTGRLLKYPKRTMHNGILVSILNAMGYPDTQWGDPMYPKGALPGLPG